MVSPPNPYALSDAADSRDIAALRAAIPTALPSALSYALSACAYRGHADSVEVLLPHCTCADRVVATRAAARNGQPETLRCLVESSPARAGMDATILAEALVDALVSGHRECIQLLLPMANLHDVVCSAIKDRIHEVELIAASLSFEQLRALATSELDQSQLPMICKRFAALQQACALDGSTPLSPSRAGQRL